MDVLGEDYNSSKNRKFQNKMNNQKPNLELEKESFAKQMEGHTIIKIDENDID